MTFRRMMQRSVDRAVGRRSVDRIRDDLLYAAPSKRQIVEEFQRAGERLVAGRLTPGTAGALAVRLSDQLAIRTAEGAELDAIDNRSLDTVPLDGDDPVIAALTPHDAAVFCFPPLLLALAEVGLAPDVSVDGLGRVVNTIAIGSMEGPFADGVTVIARGGVVSTGPDLATAVTRAEAAETLARITATTRSQTHD